MQIHREYAESLVARMKGLHSTSPVLVPAQESQFPHLDMRSYREFRTALEAHGYRFLGDHEVLAVSNDPESVTARTMIRSMISADGSTSAGHYQCRPRLARIGKNLVEGLLNFRFVDAPATFFESLQTRQMYDFESEIGSTYVNTSNAELAGKFSSPASIDALYLPKRTPLEAVRAAHVTRLAAAAERTGSAPTRMASHEDVVAMEERRREHKAAHRAACGWITYDELLRFAGGNVILADSIFEEVQAVLHAA